MRDRSRYRAMAKRPSTMLMYTILKRLTKQVPDFLHLFQNARQVDLCPPPSVPHLQCNSSKILGIWHTFQFLFYMFGRSYETPLYRFTKLMLVAPGDFLWV